MATQGTARLTGRGKRPRSLGIEPELGNALGPDPHDAPRRNPHRKKIFLLSRFFDFIETSWEKTSRMKKNRLDLIFRMKQLRTKNIQRIKSCLGLSAALVGFAWISLITPNEIHSGNTASSHWNQAMVHLNRCIFLLSCFPSFQGRNSEQ